MKWAEIFFKILRYGLASIGFFRENTAMMRDFLREVLGDVCLKYVWQASGPERVVQDLDGNGPVFVGAEPSSSAESPAKRSRVSLSGPDPASGSNDTKTYLSASWEQAMEEAYAYLLNSILKPESRSALFRRAQRRVAKEELDGAASWLVEPSMRSLKTELGCAELGKL